MKVKLSHRWRIALAAAGMACVLFGVVLFVAFRLMVHMEKRAAEDLLGAPASEVINSIKSGEPLDEEVGSQDRVTVVVFDASGKQIFKSGSGPVGLWRGSGELEIGDRDLMFRAVAIQGKTVVAASDWTVARRRLSATGWIFVLLLLPLAGGVGVAAYIAAGLMYRPLRALTLSARELSKNDASGKLADPNDSDFSPLVAELNQLLTRIRLEVEKQRQLVSDVAHDLRTPLTIIRGRLETALMQDSPDEYPAAMRTAVREAERLSAMAEVILSGEDSRSEAAAIDLSVGVREAVDRWTPVFEQRGAHLTSSTESCRAAITPEEWAGILDNLLDNAFKYGGDEASVGLHPVDHNCELVIGDNGPGIPKEHRERIFERFVRLDKSRATGGHGLGLYLCSKIVCARGGRIFADQAESMQVVVQLPSTDR